MSGDLRYFYERDLDRTNLKDFYESLPSPLKYKFRASLRAIISSSNVLQGYRGPSNMCNGGSGDSRVLHQSHGMQEIRYWWGTRKDINFVPGVGTFLFGLARVCEKLDGQLDWSSLYFDGKTGECLSHDKDEAAEKLNSEGRRWFDRGDYAQAAEYHDNAYRACTRGYRSEQAFRDNAEEAKRKLAQSSRRQSEARNASEAYREADSTYGRPQENCSVHANPRRGNDHWQARDNRDADAYESYASALYYDGERLFHRAQYSQAQAMFYRASVARPAGLEQMCFAGMTAARNENEATELNAQGDCLFAQGEYADAEIKYQQAFRTSRVQAQRDRYEKNGSRARAEVDAQRRNGEGDQLFEQARYAEARNKYQQAIDRSKEAVEYQQYFVNKNKATAELDAMQLNSEGDRMFRQAKYCEAENNYRQAYNKSQVRKEKQIYAANKEKAQAVGTKLMLLDALWKQAWDAENDAESDRCDEARQLFARILSESTSSLAACPGCSKFGQHETLVRLKIEGNEMFNRGLESQLIGVALFQEAQQLNRQAQYRSASSTFQRAKVKFLDARDKFEIGRQSDQRFSSCVDFVQERIDEVTESIEMIAHRLLSLTQHRLDVNLASDHHSDARSFETNETGKHVDYSAHI